MRPDNVAFGHVALTVRPDREQSMPATGYLRPGVSRGQEHQAIAEQRSGRGVHASVINLPQFLPCGRLVGDGGHGAGADELSRAIKLNDPGRAESFFQIAIVSPVVDVTRALPARFAGVLV